MMYNRRIVTGVLFFLLATFELGAQQNRKTAVLVAGGGTGGVAAALQSARSGVPTILVAATPWLGGMLTAAGVSATDGNDKLPSGIWEEFRQQLYTAYGGASVLQTGWVSNTLFEPHVGDSIFKRMVAREKNLTVLFGYQPVAVAREGNKVTGVSFMNAHKDTLHISAAITIDATELGDLLPLGKIPYDLGMEAGTLTGETVGVKETNSIIQDLTYVAILKDYGPAADCTIVRPAGYDKAEFDGSTTSYYTNGVLPKPTVDAVQMLNYAKLPNGKYLLNWPIRGNDTYLNIIEQGYAERDAALVAAKATTLRFIYFIQTQLAFRWLGLADDEFPTADRLALIPYHREGRRVRGLVRFTMNEIADPFDAASPLYRTGIAVGDYPIDHHHKKNTAAPQHLEFYPIPSFTVPIGVLIPKNSEGIIVAEKGISVSNVVNGTTRLQPCVLLTGQAAGCLAALAVQQKLPPAGVNIRAVQRALLEQKAAILPYIDVPPSHRFFAEIQKLGVTGILKGKGIPDKWANQTWFYPDSLVACNVFLAGYLDFDPGVTMNSSTQWLTTQQAVELIFQTAKKINHKARGKTAHFASLPEFSHWVQAGWTSWGLHTFEMARPLKRAELAVLLDKTIDPFTILEVDHNGNFLKGKW